MDSINDAHKSRNVHIFFLDGVGLGGSDPAVNPFVTAEMPFLTDLLGSSDWYLQGNGRISSSRATLIPTDANLDMPGRPQSATGQATILTGRNVSQLVGEHYGPKPNPAVAQVIEHRNLFQEVAAIGGAAALITPYPQGYFDAIESGKRLYSAVPLAVTNAGYSLFGVEELRAGEAISPGFTGQAWHDMLGYDDIPIHTLFDAGRQIATIASRYDLSFFEHWPSDRSGHRGPVEDAVAHLEMIDTAAGGLIEAWDDRAGILIITSDHGNIEEKNHRQHTRNPVPTILVGMGHAELAKDIGNLADLASVVRRVLDLEEGD